MNELEEEYDDMSIWLKCVSCVQKDKKKYELKFETIPPTDKVVVITVQCPGVPGTTYELLLKGLWPSEGEERQYKCLLPPTAWASIGELNECTLEEKLKADPQGSF